MILDEKKGAKQDYLFKLLLFSIVIANIDEEMREGQQRWRLIFQVGKKSFCGHVC